MSLISISFHDEINPLIVAVIARIALFHRLLITSPIPASLAARTGVLR